MADYSVTLNGVYETAPRCSDGTRSVTIVEKDTIYSGDKAGCIAALKKIPVGVSVTTRYPAGGRSCMNKPSLWADLEKMH